MSMDTATLSIRAATIKVEVAKGQVSGTKESPASRRAFSLSVHKAIVYGNQLVPATYLPKQVIFSAGPLRWMIRYA